MARRQTSAVLEYIRSHLAEANAGALSDRELLERFAAGHDQGAFKTILRRHAPMVLRVCQRVLQRQEDAEDAFQGTFLVLARKAGSLAWRESIGTWLYEVAHRLAQEARRKSIRQQAREARARPRTAEDPLAEISGRELVAILDEELASLPERYREPLLLCCVEGKSGDEAARQLGCSPSTFKRRLRQARQLLQTRLDRRGINLSAGALSALLLHNAASGSVPAALAATTVRAAALIVTGQPLAAGVASAHAVALAGGMIQGVFLSKLKVALAVLLVVGGVVAGACALARSGAREAPVGPASQAQASRVANPSPKEAVARLRSLRLQRKLWSGQPVAATVQTTLSTESGQIRQFAFDGDPDTYFASAENLRSTDHFTLVFDKPVAVYSIVVTTGRPEGGDQLDEGALEVSADGQQFEPLARFEEGVAQANSGGRHLQAIRIKPGTDLDHPLAIQEITVESDPAVMVFKYPVEFVVDVDDPEMQEWAEEVARTCEQAYPLINEELKSDGFKPPHLVRMALKSNSRHKAMASQGHITGSINYFKENPDDVGALVFVTAAVVQSYHQRNNPRWLVEGVADYVRYFKYEPGKLGRLSPDQARYDGGYAVTAAFLAYLTRKYDRDIVRKLNQVMRDGEYNEAVFKKLTGKTVEELDKEWRASLRR
jgi:RNA polymerase sigma factor (sigma-70 family)